MRNGTQYGRECIATLLKLMEDYKDKLIIIFAGYRNEMENFQQSNPGLLSRIGYKISFPDYTIDELVQIFLNLVSKNKLNITDEALNKLREIIRASSKVEGFGNARYINNVFQKVLIEHSKNIKNGDNSGDFFIIKEADIKYDKLIAGNKKRGIGFKIENT